MLAGSPDSTPSLESGRGQTETRGIPHWGVPEAFVWRKGIVTWLETLPGGLQSVATAINDRGEVVGNVLLSLDGVFVYRAVIWRNGCITDLGLSGVTEPLFEDVSEALGITNSGQVVGRVGQGGNRNGVVWTSPRR
jgi:uncharacterized membrane protein